MCNSKEYQNAVADIAIAKVKRDIVYAEHKSLPEELIRLLNNIVASLEGAKHV